MKLHNFFAFSLVTATLLNAMDSSMMPPMVPTLGATQKTTTTVKVATKNEVPSSCELVPPMIINLPPPLEDAVTKCKNERGIPKKEYVEQQLSKLMKKKIEVKSISIVPKFNQLYKVTYKGGTILCNKSVDAFIKQ